MHGTVRLTALNLKGRLAWPIEFLPNDAVGLKTRETDLSDSLRATSTNQECVIATAGQGRALPRRWDVFTLQGWSKHLNPKILPFLHPYHEWLYAACEFFCQLVAGNIVCGLSSEANRLVIVSIRVTVDKLGIGSLVEGARDHILFEHKCADVSWSIVHGWLAQEGTSRHLETLPSSDKWWDLKWYFWVVLGRFCYFLEMLEPLCLNIGWGVLNKARALHGFKQRFERGGQLSSLGDSYWFLAEAW